MATLLQIKLNNQTKATQEKKQEERHKAALLLSHQYLMSHGYLESARHIEMELGGLLQRFICADNLDLERILIEFEEYYKFKYGKSPTWIRKNDGTIAVAEGMKRNIISTAPTTSSNTISNGLNGGKDLSNTSFISNATGSNSNSNSSIASNNVGQDIKSTSHAMKKLKMEMENRGKKKDTVPVHQKVKGTDDQKDKTKNTNSTGTSNQNTSSQMSNISTLGPTVVGIGSELRSTAIDLIGTRLNSLSVVQGKKQSDDSSLKRRSDSSMKALNDDTSSNLSTEDESDSYFENRLLKPLPYDLLYGEYRELAESIRRDIIVYNPEVRWDDIAGLDEAKQLITEAVIFPMKFPEFFKGLLQPWKGILLFGPPGTGKTMLAKAVATECKTTFFNISASSIVSKWRGESEKLVRVLFDLARYYSPSTIFLDELDSIMSQRQGNGEHEGSRRMKTELLIQMDGLAKTSERVFVLAASNLPWDLDQAILRRLEKRIYVGLPEEHARQAIFENLLPDERADHLDYSFLAKKTETYSGADITLVCKEAAMRPVRRVMKELESVLRSSTTTNEILSKKSPPQPQKVSMKDVGLALKVTKPSGNMFFEKYEKWKSAFGSTIFLDEDEESDFEFG